jgi:hypothetical protein
VLRKDPRGKSLLAERGGTPRTQTPCKIVKPVERLLRVKATPSVRLLSVFLTLLQIFNYLAAIEDFPTRY